MVFRVGRTLWVADGDGTGDAPFFSAQRGLSAPAWSPDGEWIAFVQAAIVDGERASHIYIVRPNALGLDRITSGAVLDQAPSWSPDGTRIAFSRRTRVAVAAEQVEDPNLGDEGGFGADRTSEKVQESVRSGGYLFDQYLVVITVATGAEQTFAVGGEHESWPSWSPDGESIAHRAGGALALLRLDDVSQTTLVDNVTNGAAVWSPDGTAVAAFSEWSADGTTIVVSWPHDLSAAEQTVAVSGQPETTKPSNPPTLRWSESGEYLLFHHTDSSGSHWAYRIPTPQPP